MGRILLIIFTLVPLVEIALFILIGQAVGLWPTLLGVLMTAVAGAVLIRRQGVALLGEIRSTLGRGQLPTRALGDAMLVGIAGALLLAPGYFTDVIGILLLVPPVRTALYRFLATRFIVVSPRPAASRGPGVIDLEEDDWRDQ